jgi:secreted trypsin-like serine protease
VFALGWGGTNVGGRTSCRLTQKPLRLETSECQARAATAGRQFDEQTMLCAVPASVPSDDTCIGDSGGPVIAGEDLDEGPVIGIVSWGRDCGTGVPGVYAKPLEGW